MRSFLVPACLVTVICTGIALAQSPVAYVYVAEDGEINSPIAAYAASPDGKLNEMRGSPFRQTSGYMAGTNGSHFITVDENSTTTHQYLHVYDVAANGVIGKEVSKQDLHEWCGMDWGAELDHTGQYVYVMDDLSCGESYQSFALDHATGQLTFKGTLGEQNSIGGLPVFPGNDKFAYTLTNAEGSQPPCPTYTIMGLGRESSGALENIGFSETDPTPPPGYQMSQVGLNLLTGDPANHLASLVQWGNGPCGGTGGGAGLASYTVQSNGDLVSTNSWENLAQLAGSLALGGGMMLMNPAGTVLAVTVGPGIQFFHFNGAAPITNFTGIIGTTGFIYTMAWDNDNHLYALNGRSGKLHVYTVTRTGVIEAAGSPYLPPNNCTAGGCWPQTLVVRIVPK